MENMIRKQLQEIGYTVYGRPYRVSTGEHYVIGFKENYTIDGFAATFIAQSTSSDSRYSMEFTIPRTQMKTQNLDSESCFSKGLVQFKEYLDELTV